MTKNRNLEKIKKKNKKPTYTGTLDSELERLQEVIRNLVVKMTIEDLKNRRVSIKSGVSEKDAKSVEHILYSMSLYGGMCIDSDSIDDISKVIKEIADL